MSETVFEQRTEMAPQHLSRGAKARASRLQICRIAAAPLVACAFAIPLLACVHYHADFLDLANETVAYRYFFCIRVAAGETIVVGPGYLLGLLQQGLYAFSPHSQGDPGTAEALRQQIQTFAVGTNVAL